MRDMSAFASVSSFSSRDFESASAAAMIIQTPAIDCQKFPKMTPKSTAKTPRSPMVTAKPNRMVLVFMVKLEVLFNGCSLGLNVLAEFAGSLDVLGPKLVETQVVHISVDGIVREGIVEAFRLDD